MLLNTDDYNYVRTFVQQKAAIVLDADKHYMVETRLHALARREGFDSAASLVTHLRLRWPPQLVEKVVDAMTTNETSFFRDGQPFEALRTQLLPKLIARRNTERSLVIWSAACSSGQEPYSIAMILREHFPELAGWRIQLFASDLSTEILARARQGRYCSREIGRGVPPYLLKYFDRVEQDWQLKAEVRSMVSFFPINLSAAWPPLPTLDIVFLRNVLIYFDLETRRRALGKVRQLLRPDGALFLGGAETTFQLDDAYVRTEQGRATYYSLRSTAL